MLDLIADIGGTNSRFALVRDGQIMPDSQRSYLNADFAEFGEVLDRYLSQIDATIGACCLGAAGPVQGDNLRLTNHPWTLGAGMIAQATKASGEVFLLNDLQAQGHALHSLSAEDSAPICSVPCGAVGTTGQVPRMVVSVGTGVNAAVAHEQQGRVTVPASECGAMPLPVNRPEDLDLRAYLRRHLGAAPVEAILSGDGLARLWAYHAGPDQATAPEVLQAFAAGDAAAEAALRAFCSYLARFCAALSVVHLPYGGVFLAGSVAQAVAPYLQGLGFVQSYRTGVDAGRHLLDRIPVSVVTAPDLGLRGCASFLRQDAQR